MIKQTNNGEKSWGHWPFWDLPFQWTTFSVAIHVHKTCIGTTTWSTFCNMNRQEIWTTSFWDNFKTVPTKKIGMLQLMFKNQNDWAAYKKGLAFHDGNCSTMQRLSPFFTCGMHKGDVKHKCASFLDTSRICTLKICSKLNFMQKFL